MNPGLARRIPRAIRWLCVTGLLLSASWDSAAGDPPQLRAGAHVVDISPASFPVRVNAMFNERTATNTVDPLTVRALSLDDGTNRIILAVVDTCMIPRDLIDRAKEQAARVTGVRTDRMLVSATHTHSAPSAMGCLGSRMDAGYAEFLAPRIAEAMVGAVARLVPARIGWGSVEDWDHTFNRRWIRRPDKRIADPFGEMTVRAHMHPGHESPDAVGPSGPVDPGLTVVGIQTADGRPLALLANYSQHYYGSPLLSSDYYGRFARHLAGLILPATDSDSSTPASSAPFVAMMSQGTSGDLMWMDYGAPARDIGYDAYALEMAGTVARLWRSMTFVDWVPLRMAERILPLRLRTPDASRLAWARQVAKTVEGRLPESLPEIYALEALYLTERPEAGLKLQVIGIGDLGVAALPNEVFAITGLKLKAQSPFPTTFNMELANGAEGYIPPPEQHALGGYTTWPARTAGLEVQAEPRIVETLLSLLEEVSGKPRRHFPETTGAYSQAVLTAKPVAYWRMEDSSTPTLRDSSGNGHPAHLEEGVALYLPGASRTVGFHPAKPETPNAFTDDAINRAAHFAGGRAIASLPSLGGTYSVELWFWNGLPGTLRPITGYLVSRGTDGDPKSAGDHLGLGGTFRSDLTGRLMFYNGGTSDTILSGRTDVAWRTWHHVVLVRTGRHVTVYLDGNPNPEISGEADVTLPPDARSLFLGGRCDGFAGLEGKLDEVAVYDRALTPEEVISHFRASGIPARP